MVDATFSRPHLHQAYSLKIDVCFVLDPGLALQGWGGVGHLSTFDPALPPVVRMSGSVMG